MSTISIRPVQPHQRRQALRLSLAGELGAALEHRVNALLEYARALSLDMSRQWFLEKGGRAISACTCIESPGRTAMLVFPVGRFFGADLEALRQLIEHVAAEESKRDICLLQALIEVDDEEGRQALEGAGFRQIAVLLYLEMKWKGAAQATATPPVELQRRSWEWISYSEASSRKFANLIEATYECGLDCPGLSELRDIDDVIAGHKAAGRFDPRRWSLLECDGKPKACILLSENPLRPVLEVVYMGVHPSIRGKGVGQYVLDYGLQLARAEGFGGVTLAVDSGNHPARALYRSVGFEQTHRRRAMIRSLGLTSNPP